MRRRDGYRMRGYSLSWVYTVFAGGPRALRRRNSHVTRPRTNHTDNHACCDE